MPQGGSVEQLHKVSPDFHQTLAGEVSRAYFFQYFHLREEVETREGESCAQGHTAPELGS